MRLSGDNPGCFDMALVMCDDKARLLSDMGSLHVLFTSVLTLKIGRWCWAPSTTFQPPFGAAQWRIIADQKICETS
jgi:hypothetical protein